MVAEYQPDRIDPQDPQKGKYYYYLADQINSACQLIAIKNRIYASNKINQPVPCAATHDPYGGMQQTWANTFNPELKFSGKEQDTESGLYYFGARYYDPSLYRFLSPDPVIPTDHALYNPQRWNLYGYCLGNPINRVDVLGLFAAVASVSIFRVPPGWSHPKESWRFYGDKVGRVNLDQGAILLTKNNEGKQELLFYFHFSVYILNDDALEFWGTNYEKVLQHEMKHIEFYMRHLTPFLKKIEEKYFEEIEKLGSETAKVLPILWTAGRAV